MPLYMDVHSGLEGLSPEAIEEAHAKDVRVQARFGVRYLKYWFNESAGKAFCLVDAPSAEAAAAVHQVAHGFLASEIIEVEDGLVEAFLGGAAVSSHGAAIMIDGRSDGGLRTILFTDLEGSTAHVQRLGDDHAMRIVQRHNAIVREHLAVAGGREVKHTGDGIMASFISATRAVECATAIQHAFHAHNAQEEDPPIRVRIGISAGEPVEEAGDLFGASVHLARRTCDHAEPGQILVANVVRELCLGKQLAFIDRGEVTLKGFERALRLHEVDWRRTPAR